jgi:hypothetical protein
MGANTIERETRFYITSLLWGADQMGRPPELTG